MTRTAVGPRVWLWSIEHEARANAVSPSMLDQMTEWCGELDELSSVVVLGAGGDRGFCSGFDLRALHDSPDAAAGTPDRALMEMTQAMAGANAVFIAALFGHVIGAGVELACACDLRFGREDTSFRVPAARLGVVYHARGLARIHGAVGPNGARRLLLAGEALGAEALAQAGTLEIRAEPRDEALALAQAIARAPLDSIVANRRALAELDAQAALSPTFVERHERARAQAYAAMKAEG